MSNIREKSLSDKVFFSFDESLSILLKMLTILFFILFVTFSHGGKCQIFRFNKILLFLKTFFF